MTEDDIAVAAEPTAEDAALMAMVELDPGAVIAADIAAFRFGTPAGRFLDSATAIADIQIDFILSVILPLFSAAFFDVLEVPSLVRRAGATALLLRHIVHQPRSSQTGVGLGAVAARNGRYRFAL